MEKLRLTEVKEFAHRLRNLHTAVAEPGLEMRSIYCFNSSLAIHFVWNKDGGFEMVFTCSRHVSEANLLL